MLLLCKDPEAGVGHQQWRVLNKAWGSTKVENNERLFSTQKGLNFNSKIVIVNLEFNEDGQHLDSCIHIPLLSK